MTLTAIDRVLGTWQVEGSHPLLPGRRLRGRVLFERIEGGAFIRMHSRLEDPEIPEGVAIIGSHGGEPAGGVMIYHDVRGVSRCYTVELHDDGFSWSRDDADFAQRYRLTFSSDGRRMRGEGTLRHPGGDWEGDLCLDYVR